MPATAKTIEACDCHLHTHQVCDICQGVEGELIDTPTDYNINGQTPINAVELATPEDTGKQQTKWVAGQSGNPLGRPKGTRNKLSEAFLEDIHALWVEEGSQALVAMLQDAPVKFCQMVQSILPKDFQVSVTAEGEQWVINAQPLSIPEWEAQHGIKTIEHDDSS